MRALRYCGRSEGVVLDRAQGEPLCGPGEALVRPTRVGIAPSDLSVARGDGPEEAVTLGHEFVGEVIEARGGENGDTRLSDRAKALIGKRVVGSKAIVCGECDLCRRGLHIHCRNQHVVGVRGWDGCFADAVRLPLRNLHEVPDSVDDDRAVFAAAVAAALHAAHQVHLEAKTYVTILGDGVVALLCAQVMQKRNASVRVIGSVDANLALCDKWGIKNRRADAIGRRADQDAVIECTGTPGGLALAFELVRPRGVVLIKRPYSDAAAVEMPLGTTCIVRDEIEVIGSRSGSLSEALECLREEGVDVVSMITRRMRLDDGEAALDMASRGDQLKVLMDV